MQRLRLSASISSVPRRDDSWGAVCCSVVIGGEHSEKGPSPGPGPGHGAPP